MKRWCSECLASTKVLYAALQSRLFAKYVEILFHDYYFLPIDAQAKRPKKIFKRLTT